MSPGRVAPPPGMFSTAGATASSGSPGDRRATVAMAAITVHAPVLSIFISSMRSPGLMLIPPESKQTPLPTIARCRPSASFSPSPPERITIIRGLFALPCPTARNMPMPSSAARFSSTTSIESPLAAAISLASSARTCGVTSFAARFDSRRATFAPSPMIWPRSAAFVSAAASPAGGDQHQLVEDRRRRVAVLAVDRLGLEAALDHAPRDERRRRARRPRRATRPAGPARPPSP